MTTETIVTSVDQVTWSPKQGDATADLGRFLVEERKELRDKATFEGIVGASLSILKRCKPFDAQPGAKTGLVVGYVQSGKTLSMTTVASLARDNGCRLVILLAGVTENLLKQTARLRLRPYLLQRPDARRAWRLHDSVDSPEMESLKPQLKSWVSEWRRPDFPEDRVRPIFITVMKHHSHLSHLADLLRSVDLADVPALVMDDEADQAGLDTSAAKRASKPDTAPSTTYSRIAEIRAALPNHTYLQYTATPQAPLLISIADMLSPDFAYVLNAGTGYRGGQQFFFGSLGLVKEIAAQDLFNPAAPPPSPPDSLVKAMREFFIGVAAGQASSPRGHRSMLIHPSSRRSDHEAFLSFARATQENWLQELRQPETEPSYQACVEDFLDSYAEIKATVPDIPPFERVLSELPYALSDTRIWKVNSEDGHEVDWQCAYSHLLVGGDKLNRGFTVEGLTVTYMPRSPGGWNADTIQQRARFFGYKADYLGYCRVYLNPEVADAYREYAEHEEDIRAQLKSHEGRPLKEWKRSFILDHRLKATRTNVLADSIYKPKSAGWFRQSYPHAVPEHIGRNRKRVEQLEELARTMSRFEPHPKHQSHTTCRVPLEKIFKSFVVDYECFGNDSVKWTAVAFWLKEILSKSPQSECLIVRMNDGKPRKRAEESVAGRINQLFEGRRGRQKADAYEGDESFRDASVVTIQLHRLNIGTQLKDVPALALHLPDDVDPKDVQVLSKRRR